MCKTRLKNAQKREKNEQEGDVRQAEHRLDPSLTGERVPLRGWLTNETSAGSIPHRGCLNLILSLLRRKYKAVHTS